MPMALSALPAIAGTLLALGAGPGLNFVEAAEPAAAVAADPRAEVAQGDAHYYGRGVKQDHKAARDWYARAAARNDTEAQRKLGEMYARGLGGKKSPKKALDLWIAAEKAGDPLAAVLVADLYFEEITGQKTPAPGQFKFVGGVPASRIDDAIAWYQSARQYDPRPEVQERANMALYVLNALKSSNVQVATDGKTKK